MDTIPNVATLTKSPLSAFYYSIGCSYWVLGDRYRRGFLRYSLWSPSSRTSLAKAGGAQGLLSYLSSGEPSCKVVSQLGANPIQACSLTVSAR